MKALTERGDTLRCEEKEWQWLYEKLDRISKGLEYQIYYYVHGSGLEDSTENPDETWCSCNCYPRRSGYIRIPCRLTERHNKPSNSSMQTYSRSDMMNSDLLGEYSLLAQIILTFPVVIRVAREKKGSS